jgi:hypothetical protein
MDESVRRRNFFQPDVLEFIRLERTAVESLFDTFWVGKNLQKCPIIRVLCRLLSPCVGMRRNNSKPREVPSAAYSTAQIEMRHFCSNCLRLPGGGGMRSG